MIYTADGLIIRSQNSGENDRLITLLTANGRMVAVAKGARSMKSPLLALTQPFVYGNLEINRREGYSWIRSGSVMQSFWGLREELDKLFLATYICDVAGELSDENSDCSDILRLTLNTLYALENDIRPIKQIKAVFELRALAVSGYLPSLSACSVCGAREPHDVLFDVSAGSLICSECLHARGGTEKRIAPPVYDDIRESTVLLPLSPAALAGVRFAVSAPPEKIFSFSLSRDGDLNMLADAGETYLLYHLERGFDSLDLFNSL